MRRKKRCCCWCWGFCGAVVGVVRGKPGGARAKPRGVGAGARAKPRGVGADRKSVGAGEGVAARACFRVPLGAPPAGAAPRRPPMAAARPPRGGTLWPDPKLPPASRWGRWPSSLGCRRFACASCKRRRRPCGATRRQRRLGSKYEPCPMAWGSAPNSPACRATGRSLRRRGEASAERTGRSLR